MSNIWNLAHPLRRGNVQLASGGQELFGTVIRHGRMNKTVTVRNLVSCATLLYFLYFEKINLSHKLTIIHFFRF